MNKKHLTLGLLAILPVLVGLIPQRPSFVQKCHSFIQKDVGDSLDPFWASLKQKEYEKAYAMTTLVFQEQTSYQKFMEIIYGSHLDGVKSLRWIDKEEVPKPYPINYVMGEFTDSKGYLRTLRFMLLRDHSEWKINDIAQAPLVTFFKNQFPRNASLRELVAHELNAIQKAVEENTFEQYYATFSDESKKTISLIDFKNALLGFKQQNWNLTVKSPRGIAFEDCTPDPFSDDVMRVSGSYHNKTHKVTFRLEYKYEWTWKLYGFKIQAEPLSK